VAQAIANHYDNLKVGRDAAPAAIKAAYRKLSQKYHPDRNPDPAALEIMKLINQAWDVLSDPERRARHDRAIAALEQRGARPPQPAPVARSAALPIAVVAALMLAALALAALLWPEVDDDSAPEPAPAAVISEVATTAQTDRPHHGYLTGSVQDQSPGIAMVDIDNTKGVHDTEVRLFLNGRAARSMFVHQGKRFLVENLAPEKYVLKYRFEVDGKVHAFQQRALFQPRRDQFSKLKLTLPDAGFDAIGADQF
jgi:hypothetical protein